MIAHHLDYFHYKFHFIILHRLRDINFNVKVPRTAHDKLHSFQASIMPNVHFPFGLRGWLAFSNDVAAVLLSLVKQYLGAPCWSSSSPVCTHQSLIRVVSCNSWAEGSSNSQLSPTSIFDHCLSITPSDVADMAASGAPLFACQSPPPARHPLGHSFADSNGKVPR